MQVGPLLVIFDPLSMDLAYNLKSMISMITVEFVFSLWIDKNNEF